MSVPILKSNFFFKTKEIPNTTIQNVCRSIVSRYYLLQVNRGLDCATLMHRFMGYILLLSKRNYKLQPFSQTTLKNLSSPRPPNSVIKKSSFIVLFLMCIQMPLHRVVYDDDNRVIPNIYYNIIIIIFQVVLPILQLSQSLYWQLLFVIYTYILYIGMWV